MPDAAAPWPRTMATFVGSFLLLTALSRIAPPGGEPPVSVLLGTGEYLLVLRAAAYFTGRPGLLGAVFLVVAACHGLWMVGSGRLGVVALLVAVQAVVWGLSEAISRTGRLHGGASIYAMFAWIDIVRGLHDAGGRIASGEVPAAAVLAPLTLLVPPMLAFTGALALPNARWPLRVVDRVEARSGLDLVLLGLSAGLLAGYPARAIGGLVGLPVQVATSAVATFVILVASRSYARARVPGPRDVRLIPPLILLPSLAIVALVLGYRGL